MRNDPFTFAEKSSPIEHFVNATSIVFYQCSLDPSFPIETISHNVEKVLGYLPGDFYNNSTFWVDNIHPEERDEVSETFLDIMEQGSRTFVYRFRCQDGRYIWLRDENTVIYDSDGTATGIAGTAIDITKEKEAEQEIRKLNATLEQRIDERTRNLTMANRKLKKQIQYRNKAETKLSEQQKRLKLLEAGINHINDMVIISKAPVDAPLQSEVVFINKAFERFAGYRFPEVEGKNPAFLHGSGTQNPVLAKLNKRIKQNKPVRVEFINYKKDGTPYWVDLEMTPFPADENDMLYWVGINRDITKRKEAEVALEENEKKYRAYTELSFDAIFEIAIDGTIIECNARACSLFGYTKKELLDMNIRKLTPEVYRDTIPKEITPEITTGSEVLQRNYIKKDGTIFPCEINTKLYHHHDKDHLIAYVRDISDQVEYQETIKKSLEEKNTLLAEVHHRVKNNLAVISGLLEMQTFNAENKQLVDELRESQSRIQSIATVHETLYQSDSFSDIALEDYIDDLVSYLSGTFGHDGTIITFDKRVEPISLTVKQAVPCGLLLNELITNAYKHAFPGKDTGTITIKLSKEMETVTLIVQDDGIGLPEDFSMETSSSLGMTLVSTLVQQLEGSLELKKNPGSCFIISFDIG